LVKKLWRIKWKFSRLIILTIATLFFATTFAEAKNQKIRSNVQILVDLSNSYFGPPFRSYNREALRKTFDVVEGLLKYLPKRAIIQVIGISESSQDDDIICSASVCKKSLFGRKKNTTQSCIAEPSRWKSIAAAGCVRAVLKKNPAMGTDITGAIDKAVRGARAQAKDSDNILIILSDFYEYRSKQLKLPKINLDGFSVLLIYRTVLKTETGDISLPEGQAKIWKKKLKGIGADKVLIVPEEFDFVARAIDELG
jgi:hypothetical protein